MEGATGLSLFPLVVHAAGGAFDLATVWRQIEQLQHPGAAPEITTLTIKPSQAAQSVGAARKRRLLTASAAAGLLMAGAFFLELQGVGRSVLFVGGIATFFTLLNVLDNSQEVRAFETAQNQASSQSGPSPA